MTLNLYTPPICGISYTNSNIAMLHTLCVHVENVSNQPSQFTTSGTVQRTYTYSTMFQFLKNNLQEVYNS